ncbi:4403_t:CDS:1, partial [Gigaspora rosea]
MLTVQWDQEPKILEAKWLPNNQLSVLIQSPRYLTLQCPNSPMAVGHFTFDDHQGHSHRFSKHPNYVNGFNDDNVNCYLGHNYHIGDNPYNYIVSYDPNDTPAQGSIVTIALSIYYFCFHDGQTKCHSCDVKLD